MISDIFLFSVSYYFKINLCSVGMGMRILFLFSFFLALTLAQLQITSDGVEVAV
jgi:hypothetical protein